MERITYNNHVVELSNKALIVDGCRIPVLDSMGYLIKINKKSISGIDGAEGVFRFLERAVARDLGACWINVIVRELLNK